MSQSYFIRSIDSRLGALQASQAYRTDGKAGVSAATAARHRSAIVEVTRAAVNSKCVYKTNMVQNHHDTWRRLPAHREMQVAVDAQESHLLCGIAELYYRALRNNKGYNCLLDVCINRNDENNYYYYHHHHHHHHHHISTLSGGADMPSRCLASMSVTEMMSQRNGSRNCKRSSNPKSLGRPSSRQQCSNRSPAELPSDTGIEAAWASAWLVLIECNSS